MSTVIMKFTYTNQTTDLEDMLILCTSYQKISRGGKESMLIRASFCLNVFNLF